MTRTLVITTVAAAALAGTLVAAPQGPEQRGRGGPRPGPNIISALDANGDHTISAEEIAAAPEALKKLDKNNDGQLTRDEFGPAFGRRGGPPPRPTQTGG